MLLVEGEYLTQPGSHAGVIATLRRLSGRTHELHAGVVLVSDGRIVWRATDVATLTMRRLDEAEIARYAERAGADIHGSVGAYHIEGLGLTLFDRVAGDHTTIRGLPMLPLLAALREHGYVVP
jgi:septum formation protein